MKSTVLLWVALDDNAEVTDRKLVKTSTEVVEP